MIRRACATLAVLSSVACAPGLSNGRTQLVLSFDGVPSPAQCRVAPDGGPLRLAERGIGGTGGVGEPLAPQPATPPPVAPPGGRGVGGTGTIGVAGVITGFGSVCLNGLEVAVPPRLSVTVDGRPAAYNTLRAGERAILVAVWNAGTPETNAIAIRHEVVGAVDQVLTQNRIIVAGQPVTLAMLVPPVTAPMVGAWVSVSGIRSSDGIIAASRIDPATPGRTLVHGRVSAGMRIGGLSLSVEGVAPRPGENVTVSGDREGGTLIADSLTPDVLAQDPAVYFGPGVHRLSIETVVSAEGRGLSRPGFAAEVSDFGAPAGPGIGHAPAGLGLGLGGPAPPGHAPP
jgi:hypothetical protein